MATPKETLWEMEPHTKAKHDILGWYLSAWFSILSTPYNRTRHSRSRIVYIDGFCGPGRYKAGEPGSPLIALKAALNALNHRKTTPDEMPDKVVFWFMDERQDRIEHLKQELENVTTPAHFEVISETGRFDEKFGAMLDHFEKSNDSIGPTFAFIDPFGFSGIPFSLIERLLKFKRCEVFITFMVDAINRFLKHPEDKVVQHIAEAFSMDEAISIAKGTGNRVVQLRELYQSKLNGVAQYVRYFEMRNQQDRTQYYLFFASNHKLGHLKMKEAMWKMDPDGEFKFSDATNPNQMFLFGTDTTSTLLDQMRAKFGGAGVVDCSDVRRFVEVETPYLSKHMNAALKQEEVRDGIAVEELQSNGKKRKKNTYPDKVRFRFVDK